MLSQEYADQGAPIERAPISKPLQAEGPNHSHFPERTTGPDEFRGLAFSPKLAPGSAFSHLGDAPPDQSDNFAADNHPGKLDLRVGILRGEDGKLPVLKSVLEAEHRAGSVSRERTYLRPEGLAVFRTEIERLLFGSDSPLLTSGRIVSLQTNGAFSALRLGAEFLHAELPETKVYFSDPTLAAQRRIFEKADLSCSPYPYYDRAQRNLNYEALKSFLAQLEPHQVVVLHPCCHNPSGRDLSSKEWFELAELFAEREFIAFFDSAYQGFGYGFEEDALPFRLFAQSGVEMFIATSLGKSMCAYDGRVGALTFVGRDAEVTAKIFRHLQIEAELLYGSPPAHDALVVAEVLRDPALNATWRGEVATLAKQLGEKREKLIAALAAQGGAAAFPHIGDERGFFVYTDLPREAVKRLRDEFGIYLVSDGRLSLASLKTEDIERVAIALTKVGYLSRQ